MVLGMDVKQQIIVSGIGGQGVLFLTRILAETAMVQGLPVLTSETHGMAMRGGTVVSHVKVGGFVSPLIRTGRADLGLFLHADNLPVHHYLLRSDSRPFVNARTPGEYDGIDALGMARDLGSPVVMNLVLLGYAVGKGDLFCRAEAVGKAIERMSRDRYLEVNLAGFRTGLEVSGEQ